MEITNIEKCMLCPRKCGVNRKEKTGFCNCGDKIKIARAALHHWEEPCISGKNGAGTVFFSGCNLGCVYCQNRKISHNGFGKELGETELRLVFESLIQKGAHNIELVTPTHYADKIAKALTPKLPVPVIYNCGGYEDVNTLRSFEGLIDIYMPDMKYALPAVAKKYSFAEDYAQKNLDAINEMYRQVGDVVICEDSLLKRGVIVRHLILPQNLINTKAVIKNYAKFISDGKKVLFSLMAQYTPIIEAELSAFPELLRPINKRELDSAVSYLERFPEIEGYTQSLCSSTENFIPDFDLTGL